MPSSEMPVEQSIALVFIDNELAFHFRRVSVSIQIEGLLLGAHIASMPLSIRRMGPLTLPAPAHGNRRYVIAVSASS